ncbi:TetR/AcrR family transcriptional regulator [Wukongibacter baidiensis]|uniref:TetR/AcrR family transcriptional regulator n=1 Tax=Wukongibacter baidiensis TaxID=1723361 RepID=UPI003D7F5645
MARNTDPTKLEKIKKAAMDLVVKYGYRGTSIGAIAKKAGVSIGYLYRHYSGKSDLIQDLIDYNFKVFEELFLQIENERDTIKENIYDIIKMLFDMAIKYPIKAKFLCALIFDQNFELKKRRENEEKIRKFGNDVLRKGLENGEVNPKTSLQEIMLVIFAITFNYISINLSEDYTKEKFGEKQARRVTEICLNALQ